MELIENLYESKILSQKGRDLLLHDISTKISDEARIGSYDDGNKRLENETHMHRYIIEFLNKSFNGEFYYRTGVTAYAQGNKELLEKMINNKGLLTEMSIKNEEELLAKPNDIVIHPFGSIGQYYELVHSERSVLGKTLTRTLSDLHEIRLIDDILYSDLAEHISKKNIFFESQILEYIHKKIIQNDCLSRNSEIIKKIVEDIKLSGLLQDTYIQEIVCLIRSYKIQTIYDLVKYCNRAKVFHMEKYRGATHEENLMSIYDDIRSIISDFSPKNIHLFIKKDENYIDIHVDCFNLNIAFDVDGVGYYDTFVYKYLKKDEIISIDLPVEFRHEFVYIFDRVLSDLNSDYRLYYIANYEWGEYPEKGNFALILMTDDQLDAWGDIGRESFMNITLDQ